MTVFALIPVKNLDEAKSRLSALLSDEQRREFCLRMLEDVLRAVKSTVGICQTVVISKTQKIFRVAETFGAVSLGESKTGLNEAISEAIEWCLKKKAASVLILPADIPLVTPNDLCRILRLREKASMVISPSRDEKGTNALLLTPPSVCETFYGPDSYHKHMEEASKRKLNFSIFGSRRLALDVDTVEDLTYFVSKRKKTSCYDFLDKIGITKILSTNINWK